MPITRRMSPRPLGAWGLSTTSFCRGGHSWPAEQRGAGILGWGPDPSRNLHLAELGSGAPLQATTVGRAVVSVAEFDSGPEYLAVVAPPRNAAAPALGCMTTCAGSSASPGARFADALEE